jgi:hypothetical protein
LESRYITLVEHGVDGFVHSGGVLNVHVLALAVGGAFPLEGPEEADSLFWCLGMVAFLPSIMALMVGWPDSRKRVSMSWSAWALKTGTGQGEEESPEAEPVERDEGAPGAGLSTMVYKFKEGYELSKIYSTVLL